MGGRLDAADERMTRMSRRGWLAGASVALIHAACSPGGAGAPQGAARRPLISGAGPDTVLALMPETPQTREVLRGLVDELGSEFRVVAVIVEDQVETAIIARSFEEFEPRAVVLMNNPTVAAYRSYTARSGAQVPAVVVMTSFIDSPSLSALGAAGINYEVPLITAVTSLRRILRTPIERVGVVYRQNLDSFVRREASLASREQVTVVPTPLDPDPNAAHIKSAIRDAKRNADAIWVLNDDRVLTPHLIAGGWLPGLNERPWRPTIVSASSLVSAHQSFGTVAVLPDHTALGVQTANLVFDIADNQWQLPERGAQLPVSTNTVVDLRQAHERFELKRDALAQVDRIIE
jgi:ABC-type uncharacterized transport system substrate-binding protein